MNLITVASGSRMGIGKNNVLPWHLPTDFKIFVRLTTETTDQNKENVVLMGRNCWDGIPAKTKPLKHRINCMLSRTLTQPPADGVRLYNSMEQFNDRLLEFPLKDHVETIWNIGGTEVYQLGLDAPNLQRVYITKIQEEVDCDAFFPKMNMDQWIEVADERLPKGVIFENGLHFTFHVYEKRDY